MAQHKINNLSYPFSLAHPCVCKYKCSACRNANNEAIADTGASSHYLTTKAHHLDTDKPSNNITVGLPNGESLKSSKECLLDIPTLPLPARRAHILPELANNSLLSIGQMCDEGCVATFTQEKVTIQKNNKIILTGDRYSSTKLWKLPLKSTQQINTTQLQTNTVRQSISYLHAAAFSPSKSTFLQATTNGFFSSWPGLTAKRVNRYLQTTIATAKGHLDQAKANTRSTKTKVAFAAIADTKEMYTQQSIHTNNM